MPHFRINQPGFPARFYAIRKKLVSVGRGQDNDVIISDPSLSDTQAQVLFDGRDFLLSSLDRNEFSVGGKKRKKHRLEHDDIVGFGQATLHFSMFDAPQEELSDGSPASALEAYRSLYEFSERLLETYEPKQVLEALMDAVIALTQADKGFLLLVEGDERHVEVARNVRRENLADAVNKLSDSIVGKVLRTKKAVIVSDATADAEFKNAMSVVRLQLSSVMCVPLVERGNLLGAIYVGNDSVTQLFTRDHLELLTIFAAQASLLLKNAVLVSHLRADNIELTQRLSAQTLGNIIGSCPPMQEVFRKVQKVATTDISVLITGETGTGKELIAHEIHQRSGRAKGPFVVINCGAIPENLLESELFGHVRGAFTGAVQNRPGKFHAASGGTLFLDEIGEMPLNLQVKILRALQERVVVRVGDTRPEPVDIRVLAATNRNLETEIKANRFREDLYYRLNVVNIHLPPLRERGDDVMVLAKYFLGRAAEEMGSSVSGFSPEAATALRKYAWPGNIRQLDNHIKKAVVLCDRALLSAEDLGLEMAALPAILPLADAAERFRRDYINQVLQLNNGNRTKTAKDLGVDPRTIFRHLEKEGDGADGGSGSPDGEGPA